MAVKVGRQRWAESVRIAPKARVKTPPPAGAIVYYVRRGDLIKIGTTTSPAQRFLDLVPDEILAVEPGGYPLENHRHLQFGHLREGGEYFQSAPELLEHIRHVRDLHGEPDPAWRTTRSRGNRLPALPLATSTETVTATEAAARFGVKEGTLRQWVHRNKLPIVGRDGHNRHIFYAEHVEYLAAATAPWRTPPELTSTSVLPQAATPVTLSSSDRAMPRDRDRSSGHSCSRGAGELMLPTRGDGMLNTEAAAKLVGVSASTIRQWRRRGHLTIQGLDEYDHPLHTAAAVREAERKVRENGLRTSGIDPRKQRGRARFPLPVAA